MTAILSTSVPLQAEETLRAHGHRTLRLPPHPALPPSLSSHPDMLLFFSQDAIFCTALYAEIAKEELCEISRIADRPIKTVLREPERAYPRDVLFNAAPIGNLLFCRPDATAQELTEIADLTVVPVRQGYAKCSVIPVGRHAMMTADASIAKAAKAHSVDVLSLRAGGILLEGYDYGFPGGCTSFCPYGEYETLYFCGSLSLYEDGERMKAFCARHGMRTVSLGDFPPTDVGTIFLIESKR